MIFMFYQPVGGIDQTTERIIEGMFIIAVICVVGLAGIIWSGRYD